MMHARDLAETTMQALALQFNLSETTFILPSTAATARSTWCRSGPRAMAGPSGRYRIDIGADDLPLEVVVNKIDTVDILRRRRLANRFPDALQISALTGEGVEELRARIAERFADRFEAVHLFLPYEEGGKLAELYALGAPIEEREDQADGVYVRARLPHRELRRFARYLVAEARSEPARRAR